MYVELFGPDRDPDVKQFPLNTVECRNAREVADVVRSVVANRARNGVEKIVISDTTDGQSPVDADWFLR